jgi:hypothetical protein
MAPSISNRPKKAPRIMIRKPDEKRPLVGTRSRFEEKVKDKSCPSAQLINHHAMNTCGGVEA